MPRRAPFNYVHDSGNFSHIATGGAHTIIINQDGDLIVFGLNRNGQLGLGHTNPTGSRHIIKLRDDEKAVKVVCAHEASFYLSENGQVFSCGSNEYGQLGYGDVVCQLTFRLVETPCPIIDIEAGGWHLLAIDDDRTLYGCGCSAGNRLGLPVSEPVYQLRPLPFHNVTTFACGDFHSIVVTTEGIFELGRMSARRSITKYIEGRVTMASGARDHSLLLTDDGVVYSFGLNSAGQLGLGHNQSVNDVSKVILPSFCSSVSERPVAVECSYYSSAVVLCSGKVLVFGSNEFCELGMKSESKRSPQLLDIDVPINTVRIGGSGGVLEAHIMLVDDLGRIWAGGSSKHNQCGFNSFGILSKPVEIDLFI
ncbi:hypothetical protein PCE1_004203 [Barthelona sp. PCE]